MELKGQSADKQNRREKLKPTMAAAATKAKRKFTCKYHVTVLKGRLNGIYIYLVKNKGHEIRNKKSKNKVWK